MERKEIHLSIIIGWKSVENIPYIILIFSYFARQKLVLGLNSKLVHGIMLWRCITGGWWMVGKYGGGDVEDWLSVAQLSKTLEIPETTTRRYLNNFEEYFRSEQIGRGKKYHPGSIEILQRVATLYSRDYETAEIKKILADEYAFIVEDDERHDTTIQPPAYDVSGKLDAFQQQQEEFNKQLLKQLQEQQNYIKELISKQEKESQETKLLMKPEDRRIERFNQIMAEYKVTKQLENEARDLWKEKPQEERMKKVGWFRKEEDKEKRDEFIRSYVDKNFEVYLKREFGIE